MDKENQDRIAHMFCDNNMELLNKICQPMITRKNVEQQYEAELMSLALKVLWESILSYDEKKKCKFSTFLIGNIKREYWTWTRDMERECRCNLLKEEGKVVFDQNTGRAVKIPDVSFDAKSEDKYQLSEVVASEFNLDKEVEQLLGEVDDKFENYINSLSDKQKNIAILISQGYKNEEIMEALNMSPEVFANQMQGFRAYEKVSLLFD